MGPCFLNADFAIANAFSDEMIPVFPYSFDVTTTPAATPEPTPMRNVFQFIKGPL